MGYRFSKRTCLISDQNMGEADSCRQLLPATHTCTHTFTHVCTYTQSKKVNLKGDHLGGFGSGRETQPKQPYFVKNGLNPRSLVSWPELGRGVFVFVFIQAIYDLCRVLLLLDPAS